VAGSEVDRRAIGRGGRRDERGEVASLGGGVGKAPKPPPLSDAGVDGVVGVEDESCEGSVDKDKGGCNEVVKSDDWLLLLSVSSETECESESGTMTLVDGGTEVDSGLSVVVVVTGIGSAVTVNGVVVRVMGLLVGEKPFVFAISPWRARAKG
jgi:hypothetical protein